MYAGKKRYGKWQEDREGGGDGGGSNRGRNQNRELKTVRRGEESRGVSGLITNCTRQLSST